jgi:hypothetical protein
VIDGGSRHSKPRVFHAERQEDLIANNVPKVAPALPTDDLGQQQRDDAGLIAGARARLHPWVDLGGTDVRAMLAAWL